MEIFTFSQTCNKTCVVIARYSASVQFAVDLDSLSAEILGKHFVDLFCDQREVQVTLIHEDFRFSQTYNKIHVVIARYSASELVSLSAKSLYKTLCWSVLVIRQLQNNVRLGNFHPWIILSFSQTCSKTCLVIARYSDQQNLQENCLIYLQIDSTRHFVGLFMIRQLQNHVNFDNLNLLRYLASAKLAAKRQYSQLDIQLKYEGYCQAQSEQSTNTRRLWEFTSILSLIRGENDAIKGIVKTKNKKNIIFPKRKEIYYRTYLEMN